MCFITFLTRYEKTNTIKKNNQSVLKECTIVLLTFTLNNTEI